MFVSGRYVPGIAVGGGDAYEMFTDPVTGKTYIRTKDGQVLEVKIIVKSHCDVVAT